MILGALAFVLAVVGMACWMRDSWRWRWCGVACMTASNLIWFRLMGWI